LVPSHPIRETMAQIWYPATDTNEFQTAPYMPPLAVANFLAVNGVPADAAVLPRTVGHEGAPVDRRGGPRPVLLYSPGGGADRSLGAGLVEDRRPAAYAAASTCRGSSPRFPDIQFVP